MNYYTITDEIIKCYSLTNSSQIAGCVQDYLAINETEVSYNQFSLLCRSVCLKVQVAMPTFQIIRMRYTGLVKFLDEKRERKL